MSATNILASTDSDLAALLGVYVIFLIGVAIACGYGARAIMVGKGRSGFSGFVLGFFLGLIGVLIAALLSPTPEHEFQKQQQMVAMMRASGTGYGGNAGYQPTNGQWAQDPFGRHQLRYHDGLQWTDNVSNNGATSSDPAQHHVTPAVVASPAQWSTDPYRRHQLRYFDGARWTAAVSDSGITSTDPIG